MHLASMKPNDARELINPKKKKSIGRIVFDSELTTQILVQILSEESSKQLMP